MPGEERTPLGVQLTRRWVRHYTRGLPGDSGLRRVAEIESDMFEHLVYTARHVDRDRGTSVLWRSVRGIPSDISWRRQERSMITHPDLSPRSTLWAMLRQGWFAPLAAAIGLFDLLLALWVATDDDGKMPGQAIGPVVLSLLAVAMFVGLWLRLRVTRATVAARPHEAPRALRTRGLVVTLMVVGLVAALLGGPAGGGSRPLILIGLGLLAVCVLCVIALVVRRAVLAADPRDRAPLAEGLVIAGTLPALAMFWMVVPAIAAVVVIVGVLGSGDRLRTA